MAYIQVTFFADDNSIAKASLREQKPNKENEWWLKMIRHQNICSLLITDTQTPLEVWQEGRRECIWLKYTLL